MNNHRISLAAGPLLLALLAACGGGAAPASGTQTSSAARPAASGGNSATDQLYQAAKTEGQVVLYSSNQVEEAQKTIAAFNKTYPGITVKHVRAIRDELEQKAITEFQAHQVTADVFQADAVSVVDLSKVGALQPYELPALSDYPDQFKDPNHIWSAGSMLLYTIGYNTSKVKPADVPKKYEDLLDPKWTGRMATHNLEASVMLAMLDWWGKDKTVQYWKDIMALKTKIVNGRSLIANQIAAGEYDIAPSVDPAVMQGQKAKGAPVDWVRLDQMVAALNVEALVKDAPHPNAAKLYLNWLISVDGQKAMAEIGRTPVHPQVQSIPAEIKQGTKFYVIDPTRAEEANAADQLYGATIGARG